MDLRSTRKMEHLQHALKLSRGPLQTGFDDLHLVHQALSPIDLDKIDTSLTMFNKRLGFPLLINAITGGAPGLENINRKLAEAAREAEIALAVGSQTAAINFPELEYTYKIVRKANPKGLIFANISALADYRHALAAVEMINADALQLHLNIAQELAMKEGDRCFAKLKDNIAAIIEHSPVPIILKEVGFGISYESAMIIQDLGISYVDIGGAGGTNFAAIELERDLENANYDLINWGIPTAISLLEVKAAVPVMSIIASGGIYTPLNIIKSLVVGAKMVGIALPALEKAYHQGTQELILYLNQLILQSKHLMLLTGAEDLSQLSSKPIIINGFTKEWLNNRRIDTALYAQRPTTPF
ncbi:MAG: type 2 isopentenyl-diphosphate Delta-isomerase [Bacillota bacterium]